jgi:hypothetical protein
MDRLMLPNLKDDDKNIQNPTVDLTLSQPLEK